MNSLLLFIDSVSTEVGSSNQEYFDSRLKAKKSRASYRLEDIEAMLYYRIHVLAEITTSNMRIEGVVEAVDEKGITLRLQESIKTIPLDEVRDINILRL